MRVNYSGSALKLFDHGWPTAPAKGKRLIVRGWPEFGKNPPTRKQVSDWTQQTWRLGENISHVFGPASPLVALDIDITDEPEARRVALLAWNICGKTPLVRIGKSPKVAIFYRKGGSEYDEVRGSSVEIFATTGQMVWFGLHPDTNRPYAWPRQSPLEVTPAEVPILDPGCLRRFLSHLPKCHRDVSNRDFIEHRDLTASLRAERAQGRDSGEVFEICRKQLQNMRSKKENNGVGTRTQTIASVAFCLVNRGFAAEQIQGLFQQVFKERWPNEQRPLNRRAKIALRSALKKTQGTRQ